MITTTLTSSRYWKTLVPPFRSPKKNPEKAFLTLKVNYRKIIQKAINYATQNNNKLAIYVIRRY